jgi:hypothetical protein
MALRLTPPSLAAFAVLLAAAGASGLAHLVLLVAIVPAFAVLLDAVSERVAGRVMGLQVALAVAAHVFDVGGAAVRSPLLALGSLVAVVSVPALARTEPARDALLER